MTSHFTALHRALGREPMPLTSELLDEAISAGVSEADDLDWKTEPPAEKALAQSDIVKDIAAFANSGGGMLVFGVTEEQGQATGRVDVGEITESYERTLRRVAVSGIQPPVFGLEVIRLGEAGNCALAVVVPPSPEVPHLVYKGDYFGAPVRNHADTEWMRERQLERLYRERFDARRNSSTALADLYDELAAGRDIEKRAWLVIVAVPRIPPAAARLSPTAIVGVVRDATVRALDWVNRDAGIHPLEFVDRMTPRRGLRRWTLLGATSGSLAWAESWMSVHDSGAVSLAQAIGGHHVGGWNAAALPGNRLRSRHIECSVGDFMALLREASAVAGVTGEYDLMLGIQWSGIDPLIIETVDGTGGRYDDTSIPLARYTPVRTTVRLDVNDEGFLSQAYALAQDAVNQGGVQIVQAMRTPAEE